MESMDVSSLGWGVIIVDMMLKMYFEEDDCNIIDVTVDLHVYIVAIICLNTVGDSVFMIAIAMPDKTAKGLWRLDLRRYYNCLLVRDRDKCHVNKFIILCAFSTPICSTQGTKRGMHSLYKRPL